MLTQHQQGVGMIEVIVCLALLAVAILGFSAMQMNAIKATDESLIRTDAMTAMRALSEEMRLDQNHRDIYEEKIAALNTSDYSTFLGSLSVLESDCTSKACDKTHQIEYNIRRFSERLGEHQIMLGMANCPGTIDATAKRCLISSWGATRPDFDGTSTSCATAQGAYMNGASCVILEAY